jgi:hypothetical protein
MSNFKKLDVKVPYEHNQRRTRLIGKHVLGKHGKIDGVDDYSAVRRYIPRSSVEAFKSCLPADILPYISGVTMTEITLLAPHVHTKEMCVINFYQQTHGEVTTFYDGKVEVDDNWTQDNGNGYFLCKPELLSPAGSFVAEDGSVYLLNTRAPHAVEEPNDERVGNDRYKPIKKDKRMVVQAFLDLPFERVASYF